MILQKLKSFAVPLSAVLLIALSFLIHALIPVVNVQGSVNTGQEYLSTTTDSTFASATVPRVVCSGTCKLGSIIIASSSPNAAFGVWDSAAATTSVPGTATSTKIATFPTSAVAGTYTFDVQTSRGIVLDIPAAFNGVYVVTYRNY